MKPRHEVFRAGVGGGKREGGKEGEEGEYRGGGREVRGFPAGNGVFGVYVQGRKQWLFRRKGSLTNILSSEK